MKHICILNPAGCGKYLVTLLFALLVSIPGFAQQEVTAARQYLIANATAQKVSTTDVEEAIVSSGYRSPTTGWYHLYLNQTIEGLEVYNRLASVALVDNQVQYATHNFVNNAALFARTGALKNTITPLVALERAAADVGLSAANLTGIQPLGETTQLNGILTKIRYTAPALSPDPVSVQLFWLPVEQGADDGRKLSQIVLTWNVRFLTPDGQHSWNIHVNATSGVVVQKIDDVIHCNFGTPAHTQAPHICAQDKGFFGQKKLAKAQQLFAPNQYNVFDYPLEAPTFGSRSVVTSPYTRFVPTGTGPGSTNGWHTDGITSYTTTQGNNVWAQEDADNNNTGGVRPASPTLDFNYSYSLGMGTAAANQNAAITNLFYWNNLIHDVLWRFGFDEPSGNFQTNNLGRGGAGNDHVLADAQDGSGTNNANFSTPVDGGNGRMQMFLWNLPSTYQADSDFDNAIIAHEYGHGWSIRLTGGPGNSSCLNNAEQGGEGWADYLGLMLTTNWASLSANVASANIPRGIGTYVLGEPITGAGIRPYRYSYDMTNINAPVTYAQVGNTAFSQPHGIGSIWATMLWDMTWEIILQDGQIVPNIYDTPASLTAMRGNVAALKLVNEGLRLQPCSPSFVQARDAILQADQSLFGGRYRCAIGRAFARRGLGVNASTGSSTNDRIVTEDFTPIGTIPLSSPTTATLCSGTAFTYTATTSATGVTGISWSRPVVSGIANASAAANSAVISETLVNTTNSPITVQYLFFVAPNTCGGPPAPQPVRVVVNPTVTPTVASYTVCQNGTVPVGDGLVVPVVSSTGVNGQLVTGLPTYVRAAGDNATVYTAGSTVFYQSYTFVAPTTATYTFDFAAASYDTYLSLYSAPFNPASPATNFLRGDDDSGPGLWSQLSHPLTAGSTYVLVVAAYSASETGTYTLRGSAPVFSSGTPSWFTAITGGSALTTVVVFNPVGVSGSGIPNTSTPGTTTFFVSRPDIGVCRTPVTFTVQSTSIAWTVGSSVSIVVGASVSLSATGCTGAGSVLRWYRATDNVEVTMPVSPTATTGYYARCQRPISSTATPCLSNPSPTVTVTVTNPTTFDSAASGNWNVPGTWTCNCIPDGTLPVRIQNTHTVTIPNAYTGQAKGLRFIGTGQVATQGTGKVNVIN